MSVSSFLRILRWFLVPAAAFVICPPEAFAQEQGRLQGRVFIEGTRDPVEGAVVRLDPPMYQANGFDLETMAKTVETVTDSGGPLCVYLFAEWSLGDDHLGGRLL